eukprot:3987227-Amphidinium_carterae.2
MHYGVDVQTAQLTFNVCLCTTGSTKTQNTSERLSTGLPGPPQSQGHKQGPAHPHTQYGSDRTTQTASAIASNDVGGGPLAG